MQNIQQVATHSIDTDHSYKDKNTGEWIKRTEWHRVVTFQQGLVSVLEKHARKGRLTAVQGIVDGELPVCHSVVGVSLPDPGVDFGGEDGRAGSWGRV
ncbi:hypothetical protein JCM17960_05570 [Magnetospira thiophila]